MVTAGVGGPITGRGADLLIVDDPVKNFEEAHSETLRERNWQWWTSTAYTRLEPNASAIIIQTRWHEADLTGRVLRETPHENWQEIRFPAIAEETDSLGRNPGEALWPERYNEKRLAVIKQTLGSYQWSALYQQRPTPPEGEMFKRHWFPIGAPASIRARRVRAWDKAATAGAGDYSAGVLMACELDGQYVIEDVIRGQWSSGERNKLILSTAEADKAQYQDYAVEIEQEPGSGGKESAEYTMKMLAGFVVKANKPTGDKIVRAAPLASQAEAGNVRLARGAWNRSFLDEMCSFPFGVNDDQVDGATSGFNRLALGRRLTAWVL